MICRTIGYRQKSMPIVFRAASVVGLVENGVLSLYSTRAASRGGNHWQHVFCFGMWHRALHRAGNFKCSWQKILPRNRAHSNSFPLNNIAYLSQIIVNVHNDFTLGYKLCIVHFSAKRLSFCGSNTVCMLHIERIQIVLSLSVCSVFLNSELQAHLCHIVHSWSKCMSIWFVY